MTAKKSFRYKHIVVVHGIGNQAPNETALGFMNEFIRALPRDDATLDVYNLIETVDDQKFRPAYIVYTRGQDVSVIGFSEVYWQPIADGHLDAEGRPPVPIFPWGRSIATRLITNEDARSGRGHELAVWHAAIDNLELMLRLVRRLAALYGRSDDFDRLTTRFLGDVQLYAESDDIRQEINQKFFGVMRRIDRFAGNAASHIAARRAQRDPLLGDLESFAGFDGGPEIYVVAHSEGTVVAYNSLVQAAMVLYDRKIDHAGDLEYERASTSYEESDEKEDEARSPWLPNVAGLVTLGSPLDKHYLIWRTRFRKHRLREDPPDGKRIPWLNFVDYNDPIAYNLSELRRPERPGLQTDAQRLFHFTADRAYKRYAIPGKAHVDYWTDPEVQTQVVRLMGLGNEPPRPDLPADVPWVAAARPLTIALGYPIGRALTFAVGLFFLSRLLHAVDDSSFGLQAAFDRLAGWPFTPPDLNWLPWLGGPVLLMKVLASAEWGYFRDVRVSPWIRRLLSAAWLALAVVFCAGLPAGDTGDGIADIIGYAVALFAVVTVWRLHTTLHRSLVQLWSYTANL